MKTLFFTFVISTLLALGLTGCDQPPAPSADQQQRQQQEALSQQSNMVVGMPAINKFAEKRMMADIIALRDTMPPTFMYQPDMNGKMHKVYDCLGFGFPGATQFTNPQRVVQHCSSHGCYAVTLPQADPNGLFSASNDEGTWVMCKDPHGSKIGPVRMEPRSLMTQFKPINAVD